MWVLPSTEFHLILIWSCMQLPQVQDIQESFSLEDDTMAAFNSLVQTAAAEYNEEYEEVLGKFPKSMWVWLILSQREPRWDVRTRFDLKFQVAKSAKSFPAIKPEWMSGTIGEFIQALKAQEMLILTKGSLNIRVTFRQTTPPPPDVGRADHTASKAKRTRSESLDSDKEESLGMYIFPIVKIPR